MAANMALFAGTFRDNKIDRKGRVSLPAKLRAELPPENNREIFVYPSIDMVALGACDRAHLESLRDSAGVSFYDDDGDTDYGVIEDACSITIDSGGRIILPEEFLEHAEIKETVVFIGRGNHIMIMATKQYEAYRKRRAERRRLRKERRNGGDA
jgi:MraZ protein